MPQSTLLGLLTELQYAKGSVRAGSLLPPTIPVSLLRPPFGGGDCSNQILWPALQACLLVGSFEVCNLR